MSKVLYRNVAEVRANQESRQISGFAVVFDSWSRDLGGFTEIVRRSAISQELINRSDIIMNVNHDDTKMVARSVNGQGTLHLQLRDEGLFFTFDAPTTAIGDELLYNVRSGNLFECSFAFTLPEDGTGDRWYRDNGAICREINLIDGLFDCSVVTHAAYPATSVRGLEIECVDMEQIVRAIDGEVDDQTPNNEESDNEIEEKSAPESEEENEEEKSAPETNEEDETPEDEESDKPEEEEQKNCESDEENEQRNNTNKTTVITMERKFSIAAEIRKAMQTGSKINLTEISKRGYSVTDEGEDVVETDLFDILPALRANSVLAKAGARYLTGLDRQVQIPVMTGGEVAWKSELGAAADGSGSFTNITLAPHRLTGKFPISLELLAVDSDDVEAMIRQDIVNALNEKLEATILDADNDGSDATKPEGLKLGDAEAVAVTAFDDLCEAEAAVEAQNINGAGKYILSPEYKAKFRSMIKGTNATGMVFEKGEVDGTPALVTSNVEGGVYGVWDNLYIAQFGDIEIDTCRDVESLANGCVTIVINAFFDSKVARPTAFVKLGE